MPCAYRLPFNRSTFVVYWKHVEDTHAHTDTRRHSYVSYDILVYELVNIRKYEQRRTLKGNDMMSMNFPKGNARDS